MLLSVVPYAAFPAVLALGKNEYMYVARCIDNAVSEWGLRAPTDDV